MKIALFTFWVLLAGVAGFSQTGVVDTTFNHLLYNNFGDGSGANGVIVTSAVQSDGKILLGGNFTTINGVTKNLIVRIHPNGGIDESFTLDSSIMVSSGSSVRTILLKPDGKILIGGSFINSAPTGNFSTMAQLNSDGSIDGTYITPSVDGYVTQLISLSSGKILLGGGNFSPNESAIDYSPVLLNDDGTIDSITFNSGTGLMNASSGCYVNKMVELPSGKILIAGSFAGYNGNSSNNLVQINADGTFDSTFNVGSGSEYQVRSLAVQSNGKILAVGSFGTFNGASHIGMVMLNANGSVDNTFNSGGTGIGSSAFDVDLDPDGNFTVVGTMWSYNGVPLDGKLVRFDANGVIDMASTNLTGIYQSVQYIHRLANGKFLIGGDFNGINEHVRNGFALLNADLTLNTSFNTFPGINGDVKAIYNLPNGQILVGGNFASYNDTLTRGIIRINADGSLDTGFEYAYGGLNGINSIDIQSDGKIIIGGGLTSNDPFTSVVRLNEDGSIDNGFAAVTATDYSYVNKVFVLPNDQILVGGEFSEMNNVAYGRFLRLNADGSIDNSFNTGTGFSNKVYDIAVAPDGKILVGGVFSSYNGSVVDMVARLLPDGSIDPTFVLNQSLNGNIRSVDFQSDNKVLIAGLGLGYLGNANKGVIRLNTDGTVDESFNTEFVVSTTIYDMELQPDGKIIIAGTFIAYSSSNTRVARLLTDGTTDDAFIVTPTASSYANVVELRQDGRIIVGGDFKNFEGKPANKITILGNDVLGFSDLALHFSDIDHISCAADGSITANALNGIEPYTIVWHNSADSLNPVQIISAPGVYTCTLTDASGHTITQSQLFQAPSSTVETDLNVNMVGTSFRPGFNTLIQINGLNDGCIAANGQLKLIKDPLTSFVSSTPIPSSQVGDTITWDFSNLAYDSVHFTPSVILNTSQFAQIGDTLNFAVSMISPNVDYDVSNNSRSYSFPVINGYDPNEKSVYPVGKCDAQYISPDQKLTYTVRFQNTGNSEAINIVVVDSLDEVLNLNSLRIVGMSHETWVEILENNVVKFHFDSIQLPDSSSNEILSHGYVIFDIDPIETVVDGETISNQADIYFDFNEPIITNSVFNTVYTGNLDGLVCNPVIADLELYFSDITHISCSGNGSITANAVNGVGPYTFVWHNAIDSLNPVQSISASGYYTCTVTDNAGHSVTHSQFFQAPSSTVETDLDVNLVGSSFIPGFDAIIQIDGLNDGCVPADGQIKLVIDPLTGFISSSPVPAAQVGDTIFWNFSDLTYDSVHFISSVTLNTSQFAQVGNTLNFTVSITSPNMDYDLNNNSKSYSFPVISDYGPNAKSVYPEGKCDEQYIGPDQKLTYTVRFQNTGNSEAVDIVVSDSLDEALNLNSLKIVGASHETWLEILENNVVKFHFDSIQLPDSSSSQLLSRGYVIFDIDPIGGLVDGETISNQADIYFGPDDSITTNNVFNTVYTGSLEDLVCNLGLTENPNSSIQVYPNPSNGIFNVIGSNPLQAREVIVLDVLGKKVSVVSDTNEGSIKIDLSAQPSGIYILHLYGETKLLIRE